MERKKPTDAQPTFPTPEGKSARPTHLFYKRREDGSLTTTTPSFHEDIIVVRIVDRPKERITPSNERQVFLHRPVHQVKE